MEAVTYIAMEGENPKRSVFHSLHTVAIFFAETLANGGHHPLDYLHPHSPIPSYLLKLTGLDEVSPFLKPGSHTIGHLYQGSNSEPDARAARKFCKISHLKGGLRRVQG